MLYWINVLIKYKNKYKILNNSRLFSVFREENKETKGFPKNDNISNIEKI